ncbi:hypothetical protein GVN21_07775 [Caulobacter sp. SLTY]|nr:hypothetical protein [Caulobacter sp. SLTY]NBB15253.1 hypothetical protein [Caulobacter sp. SLTY]
MGWPPGPSACIARSWAHGVTAALACSQSHGAHAVALESTATSTAA